MERRLVYLDRLKVFLTVLVVLHHTAITYGGEGSWYYYERTENVLANALLTMFTAVNQSFFMGLFFFISGYVTPASFDRSGAGRFMKKRVLRYGIPLAVYMVVFDPIIWYVSTGYQGSVGGFFLEKVLSNPLRGVMEFEPGPLWFLVALLLFNSAYTVFRLITVGKTTGKPVTFNWQLFVGYLSVVAAANFIVRLAFPVGEEILSLQLAYFPAYIALFIGGIAAYSGNWPDRLTKSAAKGWSLAVIGLLLLFPVVMVLGGAMEGDLSAFEGGLTWQSAVYSATDPILGLGISYMLLLWFRDRWNSDPAIITKSLSDNAFLVFIIHAPIVTYVAYWLRGVSWHPLFKFGLSGCLAVMVCFALASVVPRFAGMIRRFG